MNNKPDYKTIQLYCDHCHWKQIFNNDQLKELNEVKTSAIPSNIPKWDITSQKTILSDAVKQKRKFKCPSCGFIVIPRLVSDPQKNMVIQAELSQKAEARKALEEEILNRDRNQEHEKN